MAGIYFHIPFCKRGCAYCDFYKEIGTRHLVQTLAMMHHELEQRKNYLQGEPIRTIYFGGGTPSLCSPEQIDEFLHHCRQLFDCEQVEEITMEANPDDLNREYLQAIRQCGVNRLSMGIQSFDNEALKFMNRRHTAEQAIEAVKWAQEAGFENITTDLIFGIPNFGGEVLIDSLRKMLSLKVQHISAYHLTIEPRTAFGQLMAKGKFKPVEEIISEEEFLMVHRLLTEAGYEHYEISNYALPGYRARHNASYWHGVKYLGIGPAAHSFDGEERHWNPRSVSKYLQGEAPEREELTQHDHFNEYLLTRLRTIEGIDLEEIREKFGAKRMENVIKSAKKDIDAHLLRLEGTKLALPPEHFLVSDLVIESLFEA